jgi:hypothetical protein
VPAHLGGIQHSKGRVRSIDGRCNDELTRIIHGTCTGPQRGPAEFNPPETSPNPAVSPDETPGRPVRPPDIPDPEKDPMKDPDRRRDLADPNLVVPDGE